MDYIEFKSEIWASMYLIKTNMSRIIEPFLQAEEITFIQAGILFGLRNNEFNNVGGLCRVMGMNQGNISTICKNMEKDGLLTRRRSDVDERVVNLAITEAGLKKIDRIRCCSGALDEILKSIPSEKLEIVAAGLRELTELMKLINPQNVPKSSDS